MLVARYLRLFHAACRLGLLSITGTVSFAPPLAGQGPPKINADVVYGLSGRFDLYMAGEKDPGNLRRPTAVAVDEKGNVYIADERRILHYKPGTTTPSRSYGDEGKLEVNPNGFSTNGLATGPDGSLYVSDSEHNLVLQYLSGATKATRIYGVSASGRLRQGRRDPLSANTLLKPLGLAVDHKGGLYVADAGNNRVLYYPPGNTTALRVYGQGGSFASSVENKGGISASSLSSPEGVCVDDADNVYIADRGNSRILYYPSGQTTATRVYGQDGSYSTNTRNSNAQLGTVTPKSIAVDHNGNLFAVDRDRSRVLYYPAGSTTPTRVYGQEGKSTGFARDQYASAGTLNLPESVAVDRSGNLYVADYFNDRVLRYSAEGTTPAVTVRVATSPPGITFTTSGLDCRPDSYIALPQSLILTPGSSCVLTMPAAQTIGGIRYKFVQWEDGSQVRARTVRVSGQPAQYRARFEVSGYLLTTTNSVGGRVSAGGFRDSFAAVKIKAKPAAGYIFAGFIGSITSQSNRLTVTMNAPFSVMANFSLKKPSKPPQAPAALIYGNNEEPTKDRLRLPAGLAIDRAGFLCVSVPVKDLVLCYPPGSKTVTRIYGRSPGVTPSDRSNDAIDRDTLGAPDGHAADPFGGLYVAEWKNNRVLYFPQGSQSASRVYGQSGSFNRNENGSLKDFYSSGLDPDALSQPYGLAADSKGGLYVADSRCILYYPPGSTTASRIYKQRGKSLALDTANNLYVVDTEENRVLVFPAGSTVPARVYGNKEKKSNPADCGVGPDLLCRPSGIAIDRKNNVFVADTGNNRVLYYTAGSTTATYVYGQHGSMTTKVAVFGQEKDGDTLSGPKGLALDKAGNLYVADSGNSRILKYAVSK